MNTARKIESSNYPLFRRKSDRARAISITLQQVERGHAWRMRRMTLVLGIAAAILLINGVVISTLS